ncbi:hypothetical protein G3O08_18855 [Cryomorpha ignava]|uniref:Uncharacterized protein n=1 Tax=Cryomorpha ignava TaxID=101383 RepID=A0A7K3WV67_9FLAO|nr:hypothetical protein [Cryomorpha ignava]NEN25557.1 hypothetical protein [Cryomorpha ignava]
MKVERTKDEIVIRLPSSIDLSELQDMLDYLKYRELTASSNAKQEDVDKLAKAVNSTMWKKIREKRNL